MGAEAPLDRPKLRWTDRAGSGRAPGLPGLHTSGGVGPRGGLSAEDLRQLPRHPRTSPLDRVGDHVTDTGLVVDRVILIPGAEIKDVALDRKSTRLSASHVASS